MCTSSCIGLARTICLYTAHKQYFWQGNHQIYDHNSCIYKVLANPRCVCVVVLDLTFMTSDAASTTQLDVRAQLHAHTSTNKNASRPSLQRPQATHTHIHTRTHLTGMCPRFTPVTSTSTKPPWTSGPSSSCCPTDTLPWSTVPETTDPTPSTSKVCDTCGGEGGY